MRVFVSKAWNGASSAAQNAVQYIPGCTRSKDNEGKDTRASVTGAAVDGSQQGGGDDDGCCSDPDSVLEHLLRDVKSKHVREHFFGNPSESYTESRDVRIMAGSYNFAGHEPDPDLEVKPWIGMWDGQWPSVSNSLGQERQTEQNHEAAAGLPEKHPGLQASPSMQLGHDLWHARAALPDIVALGFQEVVPLSAGNIVVGSGNSNVEAWDALIGRHLNGDTRNIGPVHVPRASNSGEVGGETSFPKSPQPPAGGTKALPAFVQVASKQLVGVYLTIWARAELLHYIKAVQATQVATGFGGYLGNKGAVLVRMQIYDTPLLFVCSHLPAGALDGDELWRNYHVREIMGRADFPPRSGPGMSKPDLNGGPSNLGSLWGDIRGLTDHENIIWVGDLNYRLQCSVIGDEQVREHLAAGRLQPLLEADQLHREMKAGRVFSHNNGTWHEGPITFYPTYKYHVGGHTYVGDSHVHAHGEQEVPRKSSPGLRESGVAGRGRGVARRKSNQGCKAGKVDGMRSHAFNRGIETTESGETERPQQGHLSDSECSQGTTPHPLSSSPQRKLETATTKLEAVAVAAKNTTIRAAADAAKVSAEILAARVEGDGDKESGRRGGEEIERKEMGDDAAIGGEEGARVEEKKKKEKRRTPAWCDRILWLSKDHRLHQLAYNRAELTASDHRPVAAAFLLRAKYYNRQKLEGLVFAALRSLDSLQASMRPRCILEPSTVSLGDPLAYNENRTSAVRLHNEGSVDGHFHFVAPSTSLGMGADTPTFPAWLTVSPTEGVVAPGSSCELMLTACVNTDTLPALLASQTPPAHAPSCKQPASTTSNSTGKEGVHGGSLNHDGSNTCAEIPLDCIAILRVEDGSDHFLSVTGSFFSP